MARHVIPQESLVHGVSQHPKKTRGHLFCERQENCLSSPAIGLTKRPPTNHIAKVVDGDYLPDRITHVIDRSADEQYIALFEHQGLRVFGTDGTEYPVHDLTADEVVSSPPDYFAYLNLRAKVTDGSGAIIDPNLLNDPEAAEILTGTLTGMTKAVSATVAPFGYDVFKTFTVTDPTDGLYDENTIAMVWGTGTHGTSIYLQEPSASAAVTFYVSLRDTTAAVTYLGKFDWTAGVPVFDSGSSTAGISATVQDIGDGTYRVGIQTDPAVIAPTSGNTLVPQLRVFGNGLKLDAWGLVVTVGTPNAMATYLDPPGTLKAVTVADTTLVTHSKRPVLRSSSIIGISPSIPSVFGTYEFVATVQSSIADVLYVQVIQGEYEASYRISVGSTTSDPVEILVETDNSAGSASARNVYEARIDTGAVGLWEITVLGTTVGYTASTTSLTTTAYGLAKAINDSAILASAVPKYTADGSDAAVVITGDVGGSAIAVVLTTKPAAGVWTLTETQLETSGVLGDIRTETIAQNFVDKFNALGTSWSDHLFAGRLGSTIYFWSNETITYFDVSDSSGDQLMQSAYKAVPAFSDLPVQAHDGARIKVSMDAVENEDHIGYFVEYQTDHDDIQDGVQGRWVESTDYSIIQAISKQTLPHQLVPRFYDSNGLQYNGDPFPDSTVGAPGTLYWEWNHAPWEERLVGDYDLAPDPGIMNAALNPSKTISQIAYIRGRLGFVGGTSVDMSEANRFFNLFRTTTRVLVDSDPFNIVASHPKMSVIERVIPFAERLVLFSEKAQMLLSGDPFSARTVSLEPFVDFVNEPLAEPQVHGNHMWFMYPKAQGDWLGVREIFPTTNGVFDDGDRTLQIPGYLPPQPRSFGSDDRGETFIYVSDTERGSLYMFKTLADGEDVLQAAWSKFTFAADDLIIGAHVLGKNLFILTERTGGHYLESMDLSEGSSDPSSTYLMRLDRRGSGLTMSPVFAAQATTFGLLWDIPAGATVGVRALDGTELVVTATDTTTPGAHTVTVGGDYTVTDTWVGLEYRAEYEFTTVQPKESNGRQNTTITTGSVQILRGRFAYEDTGHLTVVLQMTDRTDVEVPFDASDTSIPENGTLEVSVLSPTEQSTVILRSDSPLPFTVLNTEWDADLIARGSRLRI